MLFKFNTFRSEKGLGDGVKRGWRELMETNNRHFLTRPVCRRYARVALQGWRYKGWRHKGGVISRVDLYIPIHVVNRKSQVNHKQLKLHSQV